MKNLLLSNAILLLLGLFSWESHWAPMPEICDNAVDDDGDGLIDLNDQDCECPVIEPKSLIPNPSFEDSLCCPSSRSQLHCADTWIQASEPTTDYLHTCGWMGWEQFPPPRPFPDGEAIVGFRNGRVIQGESEPTWKEYAGACLLGPLRAGVAYRFEFQIGFTNAVNSPPLDLVFFGSTDCKNLPFGVGNEKFGCPTNGSGWIELGSVYAAGFQWETKNINITPDVDIYAIVIGPNCSESPQDVSTYYFFDNLLLDEQRAFDFRINAIEHPCSNTFQLEVPEAEEANYQWYKDGIALVGETRPRLQVKYGEGNYQVRILGETECKITRVYTHKVPSYETQLNEIICLGDSYDFHDRSITSPGSYSQALKTADNCDSTVTVNLEVISYKPDTVSAKIFRGESYQLGPYRFQDRGTHLAGLQSSLGCDSLVQLHLDHYRVFPPNVFSPYGDGVIDYFNVFGDEDLKAVKKLQVFDRWGELIFEGRDILPNVYSAGWDGQVRGQIVPTGVYIFVAAIVMQDEREKTLTGSVTLLR